MFPARSSLAAPRRRSPAVSYPVEPAAALVHAPGTLALLRFGHPDAVAAQPGVLDITLPVLDGAPGLERWHVDAHVVHGRSGNIRHACGGGWLFAALEIDEAGFGRDIEATAMAAYECLADFLDAWPQAVCVQRIWTYLDRINEGDGDAERYKRFCIGRARGAGRLFAGGFPAATVIGRPCATGTLVVYCLACAEPGVRIENPRQLSAWKYPRQYGRTAPGFARAVRLPANDVLAISGTAAITGHESRHADDVVAQLREIHANLGTLATTAGMAWPCDTGMILKAYVRRLEHAPIVRDYFARHLPGVRCLLLQGDVCRRELLVEVDGWCYA